MSRNPIRRPAAAPALALLAAALGACATPHTRGPLLQPAPPPPAPVGGPPLTAASPARPEASATAAAAAAVAADVTAPRLADAAPGEPDPGEAIGHGFELLQQGDHEGAARAFEAALHSGALNDAGRALAYWHLYLCAQAGAGAGAEAGVDALESFVVVAQDVLAVRDRLRYAEDDDGDFVDRFDLKRRLARARAIVSASWASQVDAFGRRAQRPVLVHDAVERDYFLKLMPPCPGPRARRVEAHQLGAVQSIDLSCDGVAGRDSYYFQTVED